MNKMATQVRDTVFGHIARIVTSNKTFQYPDEVDPSLWKKALQTNTSSTPTPPSDKANEPQGVKLQDLSPDHVEDGRDIYLVDWYGSDDPEVCSPIDSVTCSKILLLHNTEPTELVW